MRLTHRAGTCDNGPCPNVFDTDSLIDDRDMLVAVQGTTLTDSAALAQLSGLPANETVVLVPRQLLVDYAQSVQQQFNQ